MLPQQEAWHSGRTLTHTGLTLAQADTWHVPLVASRGSGCPVPSASDECPEGPRTQGCGNLGVGHRGYSHGTIQGKPRREGNKYEDFSLWQPCLPGMDWGGSQQAWRTAGEFRGADRPAGGKHWAALRGGLLPGWHLAWLHRLVHRF